MTFTLPMLVARLSIGAVATLTAGLVTAVVARRSTVATLMTGLLLLLLFIPVQFSRWVKFPVSDPRALGELQGVAHPRHKVKGCATLQQSFRTGIENDDIDVFGQPGLPSKGYIPPMSNKSHRDAALADRTDRAQDMLLVFILRPA
jgi:hypothetical protein